MRANHQITRITNASDEERLALLKEVAGSRVYEQRRTESMALLRSTEKRADDIGVLLSQIDTKITDLGKEQGELKKFHARDRERRCLEYTVYQRELSDLAEQLEAVRLFAPLPAHPSTKESAGGRSTSRTRAAPNS